jgi:hypothetical protein
MDRYQIMMPYPSNKNIGGSYGKQDQHSQQCVREDDWCMDWHESISSIGDLSADMTPTIYTNILSTRQPQSDDNMPMSNTHPLNVEEIIIAPSFPSRVKSSPFLGQSTGNIMRISGSQNNLNRWDSSGSRSSLLHRSDCAVHASRDSIPTKPGRDKCQMDVSDMKNFDWNQTSSSLPPNNLTNGNRSDVEMTDGVNRTSSGFNSRKKVSALVFLESSSLCDGDTCPSETTVLRSSSSKSDVAPTPPQRR